MGFRFRQRIKIFPGVYINIGKKGITSTSLKAGWFTTNINAKGVKNTVGAHGTGLSYETKRSRHTGKGLVLTFIACVVIYFIFR